MGIKQQPKRGRPPQAETMSAWVKIRVFPEQKELIDRAGRRVAQERGTGAVSDWIRETLVQAAREVLGED